LPDWKIDFPHCEKGLLGKSGKVKKAACDSFVLDLATL
jgi:hypothetical protein